MNRKTLRCLLFLLILISAGPVTSVHAGLRDNNLIEFSRGSYTNMSQRALLWPPFVKIYQDGKVIHYEGDEDGRYFVSHLTAERLDSLKKYLAGEKYLLKSRFIEMEGDFINVHGGVSYIRYLDGDKEILLATEVKPKGGPWVQLTEALWEYVPEDHEQVYYPALIGVQTSEDDSEYSDQNPPAWPFGQQITLHPKLKTISNPEIIHHLFDRLKGIFSFYVWEFKQNDKRYSVFLISSPGWFEPEYLNKALAKVRNNGYWVQER
jgi:hypothetical protein